MTKEQLEKLIKVHDSLSAELNKLVAESNGELFNQLVAYRSADSSNFMKLLTYASVPFCENRR